MRFRKTTAKNVSKDLRALASYLDGEGASDVERRDVATWLNSRLDEALFLKCQLTQKPIR